MKAVDIAARFAHVNTLLDAFGHAKTLRNINSSRFGVCARLQLDAAAIPQRLVVDTFLLDTARCVRQPRSERSFHVLYQLCAGAPPDLRADLHLAAADTFACLSGSGTIFAEGVDDRQTFSDTAEALEALGLRAPGRAGLWRLLAVILHLSNVRFANSVSGASEVDPASSTSLQCAAALLGISPDALRGSLIYRSPPSSLRGIAGVRTHLSPSQACGSRDALATCLYSRVFAALVALSNAALAGAAIDAEVPQRLQSAGASSADTAAAVVAAIRIGHQQLQGASSAPVIEVYDLLGAENLASNGFHTLCANYGDVSVHGRGRELGAARRAGVTQTRA